MSLETQFLTVVAMLIMGVLSGGLFTAYRRLFRRWNYSATTRFINDVIFLILLALLTFYLLFKVNAGQFRYIIFACLLVGLIIFRKYLQASFLKTLEFVIRIFHGISNFIIKVIRTILISPLIFIGMLIFTILKVISLFLGNTLLKILKILQIPGFFLTRSLKNSVKRLILLIKRKFR